MTHTELFPFAQYWWFYGGFTALVLMLLALDLGLFHRREHVVSLREATVWTVVWVTLALCFGFLLFRYTLAEFGAETARRIGLEYLAGYVVEESLSVDNIFVFVMLFRYFDIKPVHQHRVLFYGILGAIVFRAIFIALGSVLMEYHWVVMIFGLLLMITGGKMFFSGDDRVEPEKNPILRLMERFLPVTKAFDGQHFLTRVNGALAATPLLVTLVAVETTDIVFALDSVPAVYGLTREPLVVFTSNIFAILGLRSMYFILADAIDLFYLLKQGVALVLIFVGIKMALLNSLTDGEFPIALSLAIIVAILGASILLSVLRPKPAAASHPAV